MKVLDILRTIHTYETTANVHGEPVLVELEWQDLLVLFNCVRYCRKHLDETNTLDKFVEENGEITWRRLQSNAFKDFV